MKIVFSSLLIIICLLNSALSSEQQSQEHSKFTDNQIKTIFRRDRRDVPKYEFVNIKSKPGHRAKRELRPVEIQLKDEKVDLNLQPANRVVMSDYIPVWVARTEQGRANNYQSVDREDRTIDGVIYQDPENMATMLAYYKDRYIYYDGVFGESNELKVVRAQREKWYRPSNADDANHIVFNVETKTGKTVALQPHEVKVYNKLDKPLDTFNVKLLVVVDYSLFELLEKDVQETVRYMATLWNAVNLKYSQIGKPKIKISVTGLVIGEDLTALEYIYAARDPADQKKVNPNKILDLGGIYFRDEFYKNTKFQNYDAVVTMANLHADDSVIGLAYPAAICSENHNVLYVRDDGNFAGIITAAHEIGHALSLPHDGDNNELNLLCEGRAANDKSTVMAPSTAYVKEYVWSECSQKYFQNFAWDSRATCLKDTYRYKRTHF